MDSNFFGWAGMITPLIMGNPERPELTSELNDNFCRTDPTIAREFARVTFLCDCRESLPQLTVPSLIVQCSADALASLAVGDYMHARMPNSTLSVLKATGHCPHLSEPSELVAVMKDWLPS